MKRIFFLIGVLTLILTSNIFGQLSLPYESNRQEIMQVVGDAKISIVYHRPNIKGRAGKIYGCQAESEIQKGNNTGPCLVPNGQVWRAGANNNTTIEFSTDVTINGQPLSAGKYGFFAIPQDNEWTLIFSKANDQWGAFSYKQDQDVLRVKATPTTLATPRETLAYEFDNVVANNATVTLSWETKAVGFTVNVGDINARVVNYIRDAIKNRKADDVRPLNQGAGFVFNNKMKANYDEALGWLDESIKVKETVGNLSAKARLLAEMGKKADAIAAGEKAIQLGKSSNPPANTSGLESEVQKWKGSK